MTLNYYGPHNLKKYIFEEEKNSTKDMKDKYIILL